MFLLPFDGLYTALLVRIPWQANCQLLCMCVALSGFWGSAAVDRRANTHRWQEALLLLPMQEKQRATGHDIDARLLMYADAIERTHQRVFSSEAGDAGAAASRSVAAATLDDNAASLPQLHINTRRLPQQDIASNGHAAAGKPGPVHDPDEGHYNTVHGCRWLSVCSPLHRLPHACGPCRRVYMQCINPLCSATPQSFFPTT